MNVPCLNCDKRTMKCHCTCEDYKLYKKLHDEEKKIIDMKKRAYADYCELKQQKFEKLKRRKHR